MSSFTVSFVSVFEEEFDLSNEGNLFGAIYFSIFSLIGFSKYESYAFCLSVFKLTISSWI